MSNTFKIKRSVSQPQPSSLTAGELAYSYQSGKLFIGSSTGNALEIGGENFASGATHITFLTDVSDDVFFGETVSITGTSGISVTGDGSNGIFIGLNVTGGPTITTAPKAGDTRFIQFDIADNSITGGKIVNGQIDSDKIALGGVQSKNISTGAVGTTELATDAVTQDKIADNAVGTNQLTGDAVTQEKIANSAVGTDQLVTGSVTGEKIASQTITSGNIQTGAIKNLELPEPSRGRLKFQNVKSGSEVSTLNFLDGGTGYIDVVPLFWKISDNADNTSFIGVDGTAGDRIDTVKFANNTGITFGFDTTLVANESPGTLTITPQLGNLTFDIVGSTNITKTLGETIDISDDDNVLVESQSGGIVFSLADSISLDNITATNTITAGSVSVTNDLEVGGNLLVQGTLTTLEVSNVVVEDTIIALGKGNTGDTLQLGTIFEHSGGNYAGMIRDPNTKRFVFFEDSTKSGSTASSYDLSTKASIEVDEIYGAVIDGGTF